jgi:hypothetical protein
MARTITVSIAAAVTPGIHCSRKYRDSRKAYPTKASRATVERVIAPFREIIQTNNI